MQSIRQHAASSKQVLQTAQESDVLANMRDALLPKLISGELRVCVNFQELLA